MDQSGTMGGVLAGVIEGFYGEPWSQPERFELFRRMTTLGLNTYLYAPKDDLKQRALWLKIYSAGEEDQLRKLIRRCAELNIRFIYALSPGLDIRYSEPSELNHLFGRLEQMVALGCDHFALLFDDIPDRMDPSDHRAFTSFASAQCHIANALFCWLRERSPDAIFLFCPTAYCGRMAHAELGGPGYLGSIGQQLLRGIQIFWTGPEIISQTIPTAHLQELENLLRRKPLLWDNLHANDYDVRRFYCGPYSGRSPEIRSAVTGILINPNNEFPLNHVPLRTLAEFVHLEAEWDPRKAYLTAMTEWFEKFETVGKPISLDDLILFGDCFYLPHQDGQEAELLFQTANRAIGGNPASAKNAINSFLQKATRLREFCGKVPELRDRRLFYALHRRVWELREELDLLERYVGFYSNDQNRESTFVSDFHLPKTYRGAFVQRLQNLLTMEGDGTFKPASDS